MPFLKLRYDHSVYPEANRIYCEATKQEVRDLDLSPRNISEVLNNISWAMYVNELRAEKD